MLKGHHALVNRLGPCDRRKDSGLKLFGLFELLRDEVRLEVSHGPLVSIDASNVSLFNAELQLIEQPEGSATLLIHDLMNQLAIKLDFDVSQDLFDLSEVGHFGILASPI